MARTASRKFTRLYRIVLHLQARRRGATRQSLQEELGVSRSTVYRDLDLLEEAGVPIRRETVNGESRLFLNGEPFPELKLTALQGSALLLALAQLGALGGTKLHDALGDLVAPLKKTARRPGVWVSPVTKPDENVTASLERAVDDRRVARIKYRSTEAQRATWRTVEPVELHVNDGQLYVNAWDARGGKFKTFKVARVLDVDVTKTKASAPARYDADAFHRHSIGVWSGEPLDVEVLIAKDVARFVEGEWDLSADQTLERTNDGVIVRARVAGSMEVMRWCLRWGRNAVVLSPPELREKVRDELAAALRGYS